MRQSKKQSCIIDTCCRLVPASDIVCRRCEEHCSFSMYLSWEVQSKRSVMSCMAMSPDESSQSDLHLPVTDVGIKIPLRVLHWVP